MEIQVSKTTIDYEECINWNFFSFSAAEKPKRVNHHGLDRPVEEQQQDKEVVQILEMRDGRCS